VVHTRLPTWAFGRCGQRHRRPPGLLNVSRISVSVNDRKTVQSHFRGTELDEAEVAHNSTVNKLDGGEELTFYKRMTGQIGEGQARVYVNLRLRHHPSEHLIGSIMRLLSIALQVCRFWKGRTHQEGDDRGKLVVHRERGEGPYVRQPCLLFINLFEYGPGEGIRPCGSI